MARADTLLPPQTPGDPQNGSSSFDAILRIALAAPLQGDQNRVGHNTLDDPKVLWYDPTPSEARSTSPATPVYPVTGRITDPGGLPYRAHDLSRLEMTADVKPPEAVHDFVGLLDELALSLPPEKIEEAFNNQAIAEIAVRLDPEHTIDPDGSMLLQCIKQDMWFRKLYQGIKHYPDNYAAALYEKELRYVKHELAGLNELLRRNDEAGITVKEVYALWDLDRSQVLTSDPPAPKQVAGMMSAEEFAVEQPEDAIPEHLTEHYAPRFRHIPRPGWRCAEQRMREKLTALGIKMSNGVSSDRPLYDRNQPENGLAQIAGRAFRAAGIKLDSRLVFSSSSGEIVEHMPELLTLRRVPNKNDGNGGTIRPTDDELTAFREKQLAAIKTIVPPEVAAANPDLEYHPKLGMIAEIERRLPSGAVIISSDDIFSIQLVQSERAQGVFIDPTLHPAAPDDNEVPELYGF
ncbi:MAG TPA: hypothetical protein VGS08_05910 [Candidatus Saccharimonadales bacterium]|nr:hypothetical protein [Candidatus Saccharimonadales bacterium]